MRKINEPIVIKGMTLHNRIVLPPMATSKANGGFVTPQLVEYYRERTAGGYLGLVITEHSYVSRQGMANAGQLSIASDDAIAGFRFLADAIHANGTKAIAQISHAGSAAHADVTGLPVISASAVINQGATAIHGELPQAMTQDQIDSVIQDFADAAKRVQLAGFDGVEIHSAHGYLLNQFYSPLTNKRLDAYNGNTLEGRLRIHREIVEAVRSVVGEDFIVAVRLGGCDYQEGGSTIEDSIEAARILQDCGVDLLDISGGLNGYVVPGYKKPGYFSEMTKRIKQCVTIAVLLTGGISTASQAEALLEHGDADLIGVGRAILKDSLWGQKHLG